MILKTLVYLAFERLIPHGLHHIFATNCILHNHERYAVFV